MASSLKDLIYRLEEEGRPGLRQNISISWIRYDEHILLRVVEEERDG